MTTGNGGRFEKASKWKVTNELPHQNVDEHNLDNNDENSEVIDKENECWQPDERNTSEKEHKELTEDIEKLGTVHWLKWQKK